MPQSIDLVRCWVENWSWHIPLGSAHGGGREGATELWWCLAILRHRECVDLTLAVCNPVEVGGRLVTNTRRQVAYGGLSRAGDFAECVGMLNAELRKLFADAGAMPPGLLPNGRFGIRELG